MTDRGLPIVDGAPACPFVAFDDDRDARATSPDHRHRCYAEVRPAPRALAHQEAYCLTSAFAVCPTFQDWARREAAKARATSDAAADRAAAEAAERADAVAGINAGSQRNPPRSWAAPPPWVDRTGARGDDEEEQPDVQPIPPVRGGGLSGSFADRLAGAGEPSAHREEPAFEPVVPEASQPYVAEPEVARRASTPAGSADRGSARSAGRRRDAEPAERGPSWERPRRREAYPTIRTRMGLPAVGSPLVLGVVAVVIAAVALFFLPQLLGIGGTPAASRGPSGSPAGSVVASPSAAVETTVPAATQQTYVVAAGDTMSKIADRFGVPLQALIDANKDTIPDPNKLQIGQQVIIPAAAPTSLPDSPSVTEVPSASP